MRLAWSTPALPWSTALVGATLVLLLAPNASAVASRGVPEATPLLAPNAPSSPRPNLGIAAEPYPSCMYQMVGSATACGGAKLVYDAAGGFVLAYMVCVLPSYPWTSCTWKYAHGSWTNITPAGPNPPAVLSGAFVWDEADHAALMFGGYTYPAGPGPVWEFQNGTWTNLTSGASPHVTGALLVEAAYDTADGYVVSLWQSQYLNASYTYTYRAGAWSNITATSGGTALPWQPVVSDDPVDGGIVLFGGFVGGPSGAAGTTTTPVTPVNETWWFARGSWQELAPPVAPSPRGLEAATFDPFVPAVLMVGGTEVGCRATCAAYTDEWSFAHSVWVNITPRVRGTPPVEVWGQMVTDVADGYLIEGFGMTEYVFSGPVPYQSALFEFSNWTWTEVAPEGAPSAIPWVLVFAAAAAGGAALLGVGFLWRRRSRHRPGARPPS